MWHLYQMKFVEGTGYGKWTLVSIHQTAGEAWGAISPAPGTLWDACVGPHPWAE